MTTLAIKIEIPYINRVVIADDTISFDLDDGRTISVPIAWFPRLLNASQEERNRWRLMGKGRGVHWDDIDEDISIEGILAGHPSGESRSSLRKWLESRKINT